MLLSVDMKIPFLVLILLISNLLLAEAKTVIGVSLPLSVLMLALGRQLSEDLI